jgi:hypothetical protein
VEDVFLYLKMGSNYDDSYEEFLRKLIGVDPAAYDDPAAARSHEINQSVAQQQHQQMLANMPMPMGHAPPLMLHHHPSQQTYYDPPVLMMPMRGQVMYNFLYNFNAHYTSICRVITRLV